MIRASKPHGRLLDSAFRTAGSKRRANLRRDSTRRRVQKSENDVAVSKEIQSTTGRTQRLWSNLDPETLKHEPGNVFGAAALVAGTTIGAGILALPAVTQVSRQPSAFRTRAVLLRSPASSRRASPSAASALSRWSRGSSSPRST